MSKECTKEPIVAKNSSKKTKRKKREVKNGGNDKALDDN